MSEYNGSSGSSSSFQDENLLLASPSTDDTTMNEDAVEQPELTSNTFNFDNSDLTLRATGDVPSMLFRVHRLLLVDLQGGFKDLVIAYDGLAGEDADLVDIFLTPTILDILLRFIYPMANPEMRTLTEWRESYAAAQMYSIPTALAALPAQFDAFIERAPLRAFAVAASVDRDTDLDKAARQSLSLDIMSNVGQIAEFGNMPSYRLIALLQMHSARDVVLREWAAAIQPLAPKCNSCHKPHWSETYIDLLRDEVKKNTHICMNDLFRMSLIVDAVWQRGPECCPTCPTPPGGQKQIDKWCSQIIASLQDNMRKLSALKPKP